jgi:hypothetical protein
VGGDAQQGQVASVLPESIAVRIVDAQDQPLARIEVEFEVMSGGGVVSEAVVSTDAEGIARSRWTLGTSTGVAHILEARVVSADTLIATFTATAMPGNPVSVSPESGTGQAGRINSPVGAPLTARVSDQYGNPVPGVTVTFAVTAGAGSLSGATAITNAEGIATSGTWQLGNAVGNQTVSATVANVSIPALFSATAEAAPATKLGVVGMSTEFRAGTPFSVTIQVQDQFGNPVSQQATISVSPVTGTLTGTRIRQTDDSGRVSFSDLVTPQSGPNRFLFSASGLTLETVLTNEVFFLTGPASNLVLVSGDAQVDTIGSFLRPPVVRVVDHLGNGVPEVSVSFSHYTLGGGGGSSIIGAVTTTDGSGLASPTSWQLGDIAKRYTIRASAATTAGTLGVIIGATATPGRTSQITSDSYSGVAGDPIAAPVQVTLRDRAGNVTGALTPVTFQVTSGGGSITGASTTANTSGVATLGSWTLGEAPGQQTLLASTPSGASGTVTATAYAHFRAKDIAVGGDLSCALDLAGAPYCWSIAAPTIARVPGNIELASLGQGGYHHACGLTLPGVAYCWGKDWSGNLGNGNTTPSNFVATPTPVASNGMAFNAIALSYYGTCALHLDGAAYCWGATKGFGDPQLVPSSGVPRAVSTSARFSTIAGSDQHFCALSAADGIPYCWGDAVHYETGKETPESCDGQRCTWSPKVIDRAIQFVAIEAGQNFTCGLNFVGSVFCWGRRLAWTNIELSLFEAEQLPRPEEMTSITLGWSTICGIGVSGAGWCRAYDNSNGVAGNGTTNRTTEFTEIAGGHRWKKLSVNAHLGCGIDASDQLWCWGVRVGDGSTTQRLVPRRVRQP